jgi:hypothetical protein
MLGLRYVLFARHAGSRNLHKPTICSEGKQRANDSNAPTIALALAVRKKTIDTDACHDIIAVFYSLGAPYNAPASGPIHLSLHSKLFSSVNCCLVK